MSESNFASEFNLLSIYKIMRWPVLRCSSPWMQDMGTLDIKSLFLFEFLMHSKARSIACASAMKMELGSGMR